MQLMSVSLKRFTEKKLRPKSSPPPKRRKKRVAAVAALLVLAFALVLLFGGRVGRAEHTGTLSLSDTVLLERTDIQNTISATGTVESAHSMMVYSTVSY